MNPTDYRIDNPPDPARIMEGLRDTGYDFNTAAADIIDNSIAAAATKVIVRVDADPKLNVTVSIADDGVGMDEDGLKNAMRYGSNRRTDPNSLGKFGLGLKTASTAFCKRLSVISRPSADVSAIKVCWDLDYIAKTNGWTLLKSEPNDDELETLDEAANGSHGTLVLWENIDRLFQRDYANKSAAKKALKRYINSLRNHISLVYQRFLDYGDNRAKNVSIWLNNEQVQCFDPFCTAEPNTELLQDDTINISRDDNGNAATMRLRAYLLPRKEEFSTSQAAADARLSNDTQGFYVYRENRLIHSGSWLGMFKIEPHLTLLRLEFSFDSKADEFFRVDIKKSHISLSNELFDYIRNKFLPPLRRAAEERYRTGVKKAVAKDGPAPHEDANKTIDGKAASVEASKTTVIDPSTNRVKVENKYGTVTTKIKIRTDQNEGGCRVIPVDNLDDGVLWAPTIADGKHGVEINMSHAYYQKIYYPLLAKSVTVTGMDALLWALAEAELSAFTEESKDNFEDMRVITSRSLRKLLESLPDPKIPDDDDPEE